MRCAYKDSRFEWTRSTASPHSRCQFEGTSSRRVIFQILNDRCQHVCQRKRSPCKHGVGEGYRAQKNWVRSVQYFIFMVISVAASSFVLFHDARSLELLRMMLPRTRIDCKSYTIYGRGPNKKSNNERTRLKYAEI